MGVDATHPQTKKAAAEAALVFPHARVRALLGKRSGGLGGRLAAVPLAELVDAARGVDDLLLARVERMALRADFDVQLLGGRGRAGHELVPAAAGDLHFGILGMDLLFHAVLAWCRPAGP